MKNSTAILLGLLFLISIQTKGQAPTATFTATPNPVCACSPVSFKNTSTNTPTSFTWYFPGAVPSYTTVTSFPGNPGTVEYCTPGTYKASLVVANNSGSDSVTNTITVEPLPDLKISPPSGGICDTSFGQALDTVYFMASGASTYTWAPASNLSCSNCANPRAYPIVNTVYTITGTSTSGCVSTTTDTVMVGEIIARIWGKDTICPGSNDTLLASGGSSSPPGSTYVWYPGLKTTPSIVVSPTTTATYSCTITSGVGACQSTAVFKVVTDCPSAIETITNPDGIEILPNPATTQLSVVLKTPADNASLLTITDITGREVYTQLLKSQQTISEINISTLSKGMYFVIIKTEDSLSVKKFIKE